MTDPVRMVVRPQLRGAPLLLGFEGWNDAGGAASLALDFLGRAVQAVPLGEIDSGEFFDFTVARPTVSFGAGGVRAVEWPHTRFRYGAVDGQREIVLGYGPEPHLQWPRYVEAVVRMARELGTARVVLLGAYLADVVYSRPVAVTGFASSPDLLEAIGVPRSHYEGPTGIVGVLGEGLRGEGFEVVSLWAGLPHYISAAPNPRGALALIQRLQSLLDLKLDTQGLEREAAAFEEKISALVAGDPELGEYVRQLKKREFAQ